MQVFAATRLQRRQTFRIRARRGERIECQTGQIWVTQDGDPRDVILGANQCFTVDRTGITLVSALQDASFVYRRTADRVQPKLAPPPETAVLPGCPAY